jgi:hypothetical protein
MVGYVNAGQPGVSHWAADESDLAHPGKTDVADVSSPAEKKPIVFFSAQPRTDTVLRQARGLLHQSPTGGPDQAYDTMFSMIISIQRSRRRAAPAAKREGCRR